MSVTAIGPAAILDVPRPVAPPYGLLSVPGVLAAETRGRWLNGVNTFGFPVQDTWTWDPCSTGTFRVKSEESEVSTERFDAFRKSKRAPDRHRRKGSPPAGSTRTTSAPASARSLVQ